MNKFLLHVGLFLFLTIPSPVAAQSPSSLVEAAKIPPTLSLAQAAQIAEKKITEAKLPADNYLRSITIKFLPSGVWCYEAWYEPPVLTGWVDGTTPPKTPDTCNYLRITMDGTATFEKKTVTAAAKGT